MNKLFYPAIFHEADEGGFWVEFPDIPECMTQGDDIEQCYEMAVEALGLAITSRQEEGIEIPVASIPGSINPDDGSVVVINFDLDEYKRKHCSKSVKKTLSIPEWMNEEAVKRGFNFSQILQEALMMKLKA